MQPTHYMTKMQYIFKIFHSELYYAIKTKDLTESNMAHYGNSFVALGITRRLMSPSSTSLGLSLSLNLNPRSPIIHWLFLPKCLASTISKAMGSYWALFSLLKAYFLLHFFRFHQLYWPPTPGLWIFFDSSFTCTLDTPSAAQVFLVVPLNHRCPSFPHAMVVLAQTYIFLLLWVCRCLLSAKWPFFLLHSPFTSSHKEMLN